MEYAMSDAEDRSLVERVLEGDRNAFAALVDRYSGTVYAVACRTVGPGPDAEDVAQNVFLKIYENLASYRPSYRFFSWLYRIALNESLNAARSRRPAGDFPDVEAASDESADQELDSAELESSIGDALMELKEEDRALVILRHYEELPYRDIAFIMDSNEALVKSRLYSARQRLRSILNGRGIRLGA